MAGRRRPPKTNELVELVNTIDIKLNEELSEGVKQLTPYYTVARYPNAGLRRPWAEISSEFTARMLVVSEKLVTLLDVKYGLV